ncbi:PEP/pyruvate-binding domain-containing protein [Propionivibrio sp.]|uniref:PEP/pyruvate-binding domain-containing protein n=1 Tax=Propionivibrio sp. TaxID=2212460 RepID=UPI003BF14563
MADVEKSIPHLIAALHKRGANNEEIAEAFHGATDKSVRAVIEEDLEARFAAAYDLLEALYGSRPVARLHRLLDLKKMSSQGFSQSIVKSPEALADLIRNLAIARRALGAQRFMSIAKSWDRLDKLRLIAVLDLHDPGVNLGGYHLAYPVEHSSSQMPPWIEDGGIGKLQREGTGDAGCYLLLGDLTQDPSFSPEARHQLRAHYFNIQNNLVKPNYDALQLIVSHADIMTKSTALSIVSLLAKMLEAYRQVAYPADAEVAIAFHNKLVHDLDSSWNGLSQHEELPPVLRHKITWIAETADSADSTFAEPATVHALIRFLHDMGNRALEQRMTTARADMSVTLGRIGGDKTEDIRIARLDDAPIIVNGLIRHRGLATIVKAAQWLAGPCPGTFVLIGNHLAYSVRLGEHRIELFANIADPDDEGLIRLQSFQGGAELAQALRAEFVGKVLKEAGLTVTLDQSSLVEILVTGYLDKDHGARTERQIERALIVVLRLIWSLRDLDYAMAYLFLARVPSAGLPYKASPEKISELASAMARMFLVEGMIPFSYHGQGMPFETYCEFSGPMALREFNSYVSEERQMVRHRLYFALNALLRTFDMAVIQPGTGGVGQEVIDRLFNGPCRKALARGELRLDNRGFLERNPAYQPLKEIIRRVLAREHEALRTAVLLKKADLHLDFETIGSIDQLTVVRAQHEIAPDEWLVLYGLADDQDRSILYAFGHHLTPTSGGKWLSIAGLRRMLRKGAYSVPAKIQVPAFRKLVSHRLLVEQARAPAGFSDQTVRGLLASVGDGSVRIGRITFDRDYCLNPQGREGRVLLVPFTTPEDIEAIRAAEAVLVTSGGLLSHAGVTTREFGIPSLILPHAEWVQSAEGTMVRIEERHPGKTTLTDEGFWVSESMVSETFEIREGCVVMVWASQGIASIMPMAGILIEPLHKLIHQVVSGEKSPADLEAWLAAVPLAMDEQDSRAGIVADGLVLILAEALWNKRVNPSVRKHLIEIVRRARCSPRGIAAGGTTEAFAKGGTENIAMLIQTVSGNAFAELEGLLSEVEHHIAALTVLWRALNTIAVVVRLWTQVTMLADSLDLCDARLEAFQRRIQVLRWHPRIALLRAAALHEVEAMGGRNLTEADLPAIRKALRRLGHGTREIRPQKVLLVCTANIDRSPLAEILLKKMLVAEAITGVEVCSRGVAAFEGRPMSETSQALLLSEDGIIGSDHRSRRLAEADIGEADLILAMERSHVRFVTDRYPGATGRVFLLSHYASVQEFVDIEDPAGQLEDAYYRMKREVQVALSGAVKRMREEGLLAKAMVAHLQIKAGELTRAKRTRIAQFRRAVLLLEEVDADYVELVGGKGANLGEIAQIVKRHGAQVPPAFMVTTFAFDRFLEENGIGEAYLHLTSEIEVILATQEMPDEDKRMKITDASARIRDLIRRGNLDSANGVGREIMAAVESTGLSNSFLSVRSSGLQEDTEEAAFAGAAETYLFVSPAELLDWIKEVWTSFWLTRGMLYRSDRIVRQGSAKLAIVVQQMFESQVSGVIFTTDPVSGRDVIVIEAGYGLGEGVVSGVVDVDRYYVDKFDGSVSNVHVGKKAFMVKQHSSGKGTSIVPVDSDLRDVPCLANEDIRANIAMALEEHYALSQDIEFGIANGKVSILQTRPVTTRGLGWALLAGEESGGTGPRGSESGISQHTS